MPRIGLEECRAKAFVEKWFRTLHRPYDGHMWALKGESSGRDRWKRLGDVASSSVLSSAMVILFEWSVHLIDANGADENDKEVP